jgi:hypothetical protein
MDFPTAARAPLTRLLDIQTFLTSAEHLKALTLQLQQRRARRSQLETSLERQIVVFTNQCKDLASKNPRLAELWRDVIVELEETVNKHAE